MRIAIPITNNRLSMHFGHCEHFALIDVDPKTKEILKQDSMVAPEHEPGLLPVWLKEKGANLVIAGGMGSRAQGLFAQNGVRVITGAVSEEPRKLVEEYLAGTLQTDENVCDH